MSFKKILLTDQEVIWLFGNGQFNKPIALKVVV